MKTQKLVLAISLFLMSLPAWAQFTLSGELRPRAEYNKGVKSLPSEDQTATLFVEQRSRLNMYFQSEKVDMKVVLQDIRTWGSTSQLNKSDNFFSVHEAWIEAPVSKVSSFKIGRQELVYDDHRILGSVAWAQQARSHDVVLFKYANESKLQFHAGLAYNQDNSSPNDPMYNVAKNYKTMQYMWLNKATDQINFSLLFLNNGIQGVKDNGEGKVNFSQTLGPRLVYKADKVNASGAFYYQTGKIGGGEGTDVNAFDFLADVTFKVSDKVALVAGYELLSGTDQNSTDNEIKSFNPLFGTNHKFNGLMDYFYVGNHGNNVGLQDIYAKILLKNLNKHALGFHVHLFNSAADIVSESKTYDSALGTEIDITWGYKFNDVVSLNAGYSQMLATESMEIIKGGSQDEGANWAWLMLTVKPEFLKISKGE